jgi:hypothetical protein
VGNQVIGAACTNDPKKLSDKTDLVYCGIYRSNLSLYNALQFHTSVYRATRLCTP